MILTNQHNDQQNILLYDDSENHYRNLRKDSVSLPFLNNTIFFPKIFEFSWKVSFQCNIQCSIFSLLLKYKCPDEQFIDVVSVLCELEGSCSSKEAGKI